MRGYVTGIGTRGPWWLGLLCAWTALLPACGAGGDRFVPTASLSLSASAPGQVLEGDRVELDASGSSVPPGSRWQWQQTGGAGVNIENADTPVAWFDAPTLRGAGEGTLTFAVTVTDPEGRTWTDEVRVAVRGRALLAWQADPSVSGRYDLFTADLANGVARAVAQDVLMHGFAPRGNRLAFIARGPGGAYVVSCSSLDGSPSRTVSGPLAVGGNVAWFAWAPDGIHLAFIADRDLDGRFELYVTTCEAGVPWRVSRPLVTGGDVHLARWSPDGTRLAYVANALDSSTAELFAVHRDGRNAVRLSRSLDIGAQVRGDFAWRPQGTHVAYRAEGSVGRGPELHVASADGTSDVKVSAPLVLGGRVSEHAWSPDGRRLAYVATQRDASISELFSVHADGSNPSQVSRDLDSSQTLRAFSWSPDGERVAYLANGGVFNRVGLYVGQPDLPMPMVIQVNDPGHELAEVLEHAWAPEGAWLAYRADDVSAGRIELFRSRADGSEKGRPVSGRLDPDMGGSVDAFLWSRDGTALAYLANQHRADQVDLYTADLVSEAGTRRSLVPSSGDVMDPVWSANGVTLAYVADGDVYVTSADGSVPARSVSTSGPAHTTVRGLAFQR